MDPRDRIESMVNLLASNHPLIADRKEEIKSKAKEALTDYAKKANFNGNPYALATGSIYRTTLLNNIPLTQKEIERCVGITELTIAKNYQKINDTLKLTE